MRRDVYEDHRPWRPRCPDGRSQAIPASRVRNRCGQDDCLRNPDIVMTGSGVSWFQIQRHRIVALRPSSLDGSAVSSRHDNTRMGRLIIEEGDGSLRTYLAVGVESHIDLYGVRFAGLHGGTS
jgi:hypothetical protein